MKVNNFTVSKSMEIYRNGEKHSYFVSMNVDPEVPLTPEELPRFQLEAASFAKRACILNALTDGNLRVEEANELLQTLKANTEALKQQLDKKKEEG